MFLRRILVSFLLFFSWTFAISQTYPVQVSTFIAPPYSPYLSDYTTSATDKISVNLLFNDPVRFELGVKLRVTIEGSGITITTRPDYNPEPLYLQSGIPERLTGTELAPYLDPRNLDFRGLDKRQYERTGALPEGVYRICIEVYEISRNLRVSNSGCTFAWMILNDPPLINIPFDGEKVRIQEPQMVVFQWTPRHTGSPNSAFSTEYEVELVEIRPKGRNPNDAILTSPPIFTTTTQSSMLIYGPAETPLIPGQQYALRVRARSMSGAEELDLFKNHGYSQVIMFQYGDQCLSPENIGVASTNPARIDARWEPRAEHTSFKIRYKEKNRPDAQWFEETTVMQEHSVGGLRPNTEYLVQVQGYCGVINNDEAKSFSVKTPPVKDTDFVCGSESALASIDRSTLKSSLKPFDIIQSGDFKIALTEVSGGNGSFSGKGIAMIPWFKFATFKVEFANIRVNENNQVFEGNIKSTLDAGSEVIYDEGYIRVPENGQQPADNNNGGDDQQPDGGNDQPDQPGPSDGLIKDGVLVVRQEIKDVTVNPETNTIVVTHEDNSTSSYERPARTDGDGFESVQVRDGSGDIWNVDGAGNVSRPTVPPDQSSGYLAQQYYKDVGIGSNTDLTFTFLTPSGSYLILPPDVKDVTTFFGYYGDSFIENADLYREFLTIVPGTLRGFKIGERTFYARIERSGETFTLTGYFDQYGKPYTTSEYSTITASSYEEKAIIHAFGEFGSEQGLFALRMNTPDAAEFKSPETILDCFSFSVTPAIERKAIKYESTAGLDQFAMNKDILSWAFTNYSGDDTYLIRNKMAELKLVYPRFVEGLTHLFGKWSAGMICRDGGGSFEIDLRNEICTSVYVPGGGTVPQGSTQYSVKKDVTIPASARAWMERFYQYLTGAIGKHQLNIQEQITQFNSNPAGIDNIDVSEIRNFINKVSGGDISRLNEQAVLYMISKILNHWTRERNEPKHDGEGAILKLLAYIDPKIYKPVLEGLEKHNLLDPDKFLLEQLFTKVHDNFFFQEDNKLTMVSLLTRMVLADKTFYGERLDQAYAQLDKRAFVLQYNNFIVQAGKSYLYGSNIYSVIDATSGGALTSELKTYDLKYEWLTEENKVEVTQYQEMGFRKTNADPPVVLRPFDLIFFVNLSNLSAVEELMSPFKLTDVPLPAITMLYATDKAGEKTINDGIATTFDVASLVFSGGSYAVLRGAGALYNARKIFLMADMASSGLSITATATSDYSSENNSNISNVLQKLSAVTGVISLGDIAAQRLRNARSVSEMITEAKSVSQPVRLLSKDELESIFTDFQKLTQAELARIVSKYPAETENAISLTIKYLKDAVNASKASKVEDAKNLLARIGDAVRNDNLVKLVNNLSEKDPALKNWLISSIDQGIMSVISSPGNPSMATLALRLNGNDKVLGDIKMNGETAGVTWRNNVPDEPVVRASEIKHVSPDGRYAIRCNATACDVELGACFTAGTLVRTAEGEVPIEDIREGDNVHTFNHICEESAVTKVVRTMKRSWYKLYRVIAGRDTIFATPSHPFYISGIKKYISADSLQRGMQLLTVAGASLAVDDVKAIDTLVTVYNFEVAENHNYYVGDQGILVHNANRDCFFAKLGMSDEVNEKLTLKMESLQLTAEQKTLFKADLSDKVFLDAITENVDLVDAWKLLNKFSLVELRKNPGALVAFSTKKPNRPGPETYLDASYIRNHLAKFDGEVSTLTFESSLNDYPNIGRDNGLFVLPKAEMDKLLAKTGGNVALIEKELGIPPQLWTNRIQDPLKPDKLVRIDIKQSQKLRMASGNEDAANELWLPGGKTPEGWSEAVIEPVPVSRMDMYTKKHIAP